MGHLAGANAIGRLEVTSPGTFDVQTISFRPWPATLTISFTLQVRSGSAEYPGNKIARFDPVAGTWTEYPIPTPASQPTGLTVLAGEPIQVWFCEQAGNKLGLLTITAAGTSQFAEFPLPVGRRGAGEHRGHIERERLVHRARTLWDRAIRPVCLAVQPRQRLWHLYLRTRLAILIRQDPMTSRSTGKESPGFTEPVSNRIGRLNPRDHHEFRMVPCQYPQQWACRPGSALGYVWFTEMIAVG